MLQKTYVRGTEQKMNQYCSKNSAPGPRRFVPRSKDVRMEGFCVSITRTSTPGMNLRFTERSHGYHRYACIGMREAG